MQIKGTRERGGHVKNVRVMDCQLLQITIFSKLNYNNDGEAAPQPPVFENFVFQNIDLSKASLAKPAIDINGFADTAHKLKNVNFTNILVPENSKIVVNDAEKVVFTDVQSASGTKPLYSVANSTEIIY